MNTTVKTNHSMTGGLLLWAAIVMILVIPSLVSSYMAKPMVAPMPQAQVQH